MTGTIRTFDPEMQKSVHARTTRIAENIAAAGGATAEVSIPPAANDSPSPDEGAFITGVRALSAVDYLAGDGA